MDLRVYFLRQKVEDDEIALRWCETTKMVADLGTKLLPEDQFVFLRDLMNGYALVKAAGHQDVPVGVFDVATASKSKSRL